MKHYRITSETFTSLGFRLETSNNHRFVKEVYYYDGILDFYLTFIEVDLGEWACEIYRPGQAPNQGVGFGLYTTEFEIKTLCHLITDY